MALESKKRSPDDRGIFFLRKRRGNRITSVPWEKHVQNVALFPPLRKRESEECESSLSLSLFLPYLGEEGDNNKGGSLSPSLEQKGGKREQGKDSPHKSQITWGKLDVGK